VESEVGGERIMEGCWKKWKRKRGEAVEWLVA